MQVARTTTDADSIFKAECTRVVKLVFKLGFNLERLYEFTIRSKPKLLTALCRVLCESFGCEWAGVN
jgi:hypothetical protein